MKTCKDAGLYLGRVMQHAVSASRNKCVQFVAKLKLEKYEDKHGEMAELGEPESIHAFLTLTKRDGRVNKHQVKSLSNAFGWDGTNLAALQNSDLTTHEVEIVIDDDEDQQGNKRVVVSWINSPGGRAIKTLTEAELGGLQSVFDNALKAEASAHDDATGAGMPKDEEIPF